MYFFTKDLFNHSLGGGGAMYFFRPPLTKFNLAPIETTKTQNKEQKQILLSIYIYFVF